MAVYKRKLATTCTAGFNMKINRHVMKMLQAIILIIMNMLSGFWTSHLLCLSS